MDFIKYFYFIFQASMLTSFACLYFHSFQLSFSLLCTFIFSVFNDLYADFTVFHFDLFFTLILLQAIGQIKAAPVDTQLA